MYLYFIRHGESEGNKLGIIQGWQDFSLSGVGKKQAEQLAHFLESKPLDFIYCSDLTRAYETASVVAERQQLTAHKWEKLREINLGPLEGKTRKEIDDQYPEVKEHSLLTSGVVGTESVSEITSRCKYLLDQMSHAHDGKHVALVAHGGLISIMLMYILLGDEWHLYHRPFQIDNTSITLVEFKSDRKPSIHYINRTTHLELEELQQNDSLLNKEA
ncbi:histidine phosphatase family protein [Alkalihalophilus pseudofirmus]|nr:histidine phosphatase family protein [Alkalihalophilus pseudofirmus]